MDTPRLSQAFTTPESKHRYVRRLFATIADRYDLITRLFSFGRDQHWKSRLVTLGAIARGEAVLDLACGTGDIAWLAHARGADVLGLDLTLRMIILARAKASAATDGGRVQWMVGDMSALPVPAASFDVVTTGYGLRNVPDLTAALAEIHRVLRPGGRLCSLDFDKPESTLVRSVFLAHLTIVGSAVGWILHSDPDTYRYIPASIRRYPGARGVAALMRQAGFVDVQVVPVFGGLMAMHLAVKT